MSNVNSLEICYDSNIEEVSVSSPDVDQSGVLGRPILTHTGSVQVHLHAPNSWPPVDTPRAPIHTFPFLACTTFSHQSRSCLYLWLLCRGASESWYMYQGAAAEACFKGALWIKQVSINKSAYSGNKQRNGHSTWQPCNWRLYTNEPSRCPLNKDWTQTVSNQVPKLILPYSFFLSCWGNHQSKDHL